MAGTAHIFLEEAHIWTASQSVSGIKSLYMDCQSAHVWKKSIQMDRQSVYIWPAARLSRLHFLPVGFLCPAARLFLPN